MYLWLMGRPEDRFKPNMQICFDTGLEIHKEAGSKGNHAEVNFKKQ